MLDLFSCRGSTIIFICAAGRPWGLRHRGRLLPLPVAGGCVCPCIVLLTLCVLASRASKRKSCLLVVQSLSVVLPACVF